LGRKQAVLFLKKKHQKNFYLRWGVAGDAAKAQRNQKSFAELFFRKATAYLPPSS
jgi:hypothetical protein